MAPKMPGALSVRFLDVGLSFDWTTSLKFSVKLRDTCIFYFNTVFESPTSVSTQILSQKCRYIIGGVYIACQLKKGFLFFFCFYFSEGVQGN